MCPVLLYAETLHSKVGETFPFGREEDSGNNRLEVVVVHLKPGLSRPW